MRAAIEVEDLGKRYQLGNGEPYLTLRETIMRLGRTLTLREKPRAAEPFWSLRHASFRVQPGEAVALIGRNGAGKSTLLKLLSRITEPSEGRARIRGRVGSLLEVGTGFHPELSGRENVFLNGAILGMRRTEISRRFDEIVAYAELERFIDTPVKRYSSGMYTRLAFSVAAHLQTEILLVDEVLAVGDAAFQRKCLGTMREVTHQGRTVLFVSHNMAAVRTLCPRGLLLEAGALAFDGPMDECVRRYQQAHAGTSERWQRPETASSPALSIDEVRVALGGEQPQHQLAVELALQSRAAHRPAFVAIDLADASGTVLMQAEPTSTGFIASTHPRHRLRLDIELPPLVPGEYFLSAWVGSHNTETLDHVHSCVRFEITDAPVAGRTFPYSSDHGRIVPRSRYAYSPDA